MAEKYDFIIIDLLVDLCFIRHLLVFSRSRTQAAWEKPLQ